MLPPAISGFSRPPDAKYETSSRSVLKKTSASRVTISLRTQGGGGGVERLPYKSDVDARRKIKIKPIRETNVGVAQT